MRSSAIVAPLLGLAFAFDAVNGERSEGTLPRLLAQPIYRDDVINGKFVAGMAVIGLVLVSVVVLIAGFGMLRLGIVPHARGGPPAHRVGRRHVPVCRAVARLRPAPVGRDPSRGDRGAGRLRRVAPRVRCSVASSRRCVNGLFTPAAGRERRHGPRATRSSRSSSPGSCRARCTRRSSDGASSTRRSNARDVTCRRRSASTQQAPAADPVACCRSSQSLLLVWPQIVALVALAVVCFAAAYIAFMRQEVRA